MIKVRALLCGSAVMALAFATVPADAREGRTMTVHLPAQPLAASLRVLAEQSGQSVLADSNLVGNRTAPALDGQLTLQQALHALLAGSGLTIVKVGNSLVVRSAASEAGADIVVTGTRIRGEETASPTITVGQVDIANAGLADLGTVMRRIPQSFGGGQNPGLGMNVPEGSGVDLGGSSSANLRGLGSDATLTLLNGHRLAFNAAQESVDISAIPVSAVDRIEVVPDGSSAIYGSDAVAGVVNVILRRDFDGLETNARIGGTTDGGGFQQLYGALAGKSWSTGGLYAAYEYGDDATISANQRSYAADVSPNLDLFPSLRHHSVLASAHQDFGSGVSVDFETLYNVRWSHLTYPTLPGGNLFLGQGTFQSRDQSFGLAPSLGWDLAGGWHISLAGTYGRERVEFHSTECASGECADYPHSFYRNGEHSLDLSASGPLFDLPGGSAKIAVGAGFRSTSFERFAGAGSIANGGGSQSDYFAYGELGLPLIGRSQNIPLVNRLNADLALRYERYPGIDNVFSPKIGLSWWLTRDIALKGTFGTSFKAPTLYDKYQPRAVLLYPPTSFGASEVPMIIYGGSGTLKPQRATTWSTTLQFTPHSVPGLSLEATYFNVDYRDRIVQPIPSLSGALSNPIYVSQLTFDLTPEMQAAALASAGTIFNYSGAPYDPSTVSVLIDDALVNAGRQRARGFDIEAKYYTDLPKGQTLALSLNASYLDSQQQLSASQPTYPLAGTIFNPPHWRGNASATWKWDNLTLSANANYIGGVGDTRSTPEAWIHSLTTLDLTLGYSTSERSPLGRNRLTLSVQNLFNAKPAQIATSQPSDTPYDSTNYSPVGRLIAIEVTHSW